MVNWQLLRRTQLKILLEKYNVGRLAYHCRANASSNENTPQDSPGTLRLTIDTKIGAVKQNYSFQ